MQVMSEDSWSQWNKAVKSERKASVKQTRAPDVFNGILYSGLPEEEKTVDRLSQDGFLAITAGGDPIARTMAIGSYYLLTNPKDLELLHKELDAVMPDRTRLPELSELESLPFLVRRINFKAIHYYYYFFLLLFVRISGLPGPYTLACVYWKRQRPRQFPQGFSC